MPSNVEIKARVKDVEHLKKLAAHFSGSEPTVIDQEDTFFNVPNGRLKLRKMKGQQSQLIFYKRSDETGPKSSDYNFFHTDDPESLETTLQSALGVKGKVKKIRLLYLVGQTRVHVDNVEGLGNFMELEVVMKDGQSVEEGQAVANELMKKLDVHESDLISGAYMDLILNNKQSG
ncbi:uncharacterized protein LOC123536246 [Mercenaria mercenaria]|uniref:uncharacterized protein LOC123536246 n=1 Tax=Mercenaria mercenaria TaxID=6596 RepID=UPI001E1D3512|nr:uncharacterized protein LOC123536246 [Mercenaria mercenaria]XP_045175179.1 uncharacterized protein LOC123536246 [Mercenaria mercenaria]